MYLSAQSDSYSILRQIFLITEDGSTTLSSLTQYNGQINPFVVEKSVYLTTTLNDDVMKTLNGVIFISSKKKRADSCLGVYNIGHETGIGNDNIYVCTYLILNTSLNKYVISQWSQDPTSKAYLYAGIPQDSPEPENTQIFSNPVHTNEGDFYFYYVNDFSLSMTAFYVKRFNNVFFVIDQENSSNRVVNGSWTRDVTSTGFYMKPLGSADNTTIVNIKRDTKHTGFSGANVVGNLPNGGSVTVGFYGDGTKYERTVTPNTSITSWTIPYIERTFQVSSTNGKDGEYYVQYFVSEGSLNGSIVTTTSPPPSTTSKFRIEATTTSKFRIEATTRSTGLVRFVLSMATLMMFWL